MVPLVTNPGAKDGSPIRARWHYHPLWLGYVMSFVLIGVGRFAQMEEPWLDQFPFLFFYPAIAITSFLGGLGPGVAAMLLGGAVALLLSSPAPEAFNWFALAIVGPLVAIGFAHLRYIRDRARSLARELEEFKFIGDHASDWILLLEESGHIRYVNHKASIDLGWTERELRGRHIELLVTEADRPSLQVALDIAKSGISRPIELAFECRDKSLAHVELGCTAVRTGGDQVIHAAARDISERRQIEKTLNEVRHWESLGVLAGGLAHDFNNLLTTILGNAGLALDVLPRNHEAATMLTAIVAAGERSTELVRMLLATAGHRSRYSEQLKPSQLLESTLATRRLPSDIRIVREVTSEAETTPFRGDRQSLETLLWSLISNAAESYRVGGGDVRIAIHRGAAPGAKHDAGKLARFEEGDPGMGDCLGIVVEDRGSGMSPEILKRAFDPFFSTRFTGRGLGLPAVRGIVRAYFGKLLLETSGEGTRVEVWLPAERAEGEGIFRNQMAPAAAQNARTALP
jgi:PAS domain S-box-containing protein